MAMSVEECVFAAADATGVPYRRVEIDPEFADTAAFCEKYGYPMEKSANAILVSSKKEPKKHAVCVVLATTRLDVNKKVTELLGVARASFASADEMHALTGMEVGGLTPLALPQDLPLYIDARIRDLDWVIIGSGGRSSKIQISPEVFPRVGGRFIDLAKDPD
jgi:prolyl-tRNA editing enzyme YbaK/EbsC (Cys-tRNA(Pro) deacylase)